MMPDPLVSTAPDALLQFFPAGMPRRNTFAGPAFVLTTAGQASVAIDGRPYALLPGTLLCLLPSHLLESTRIGDGFQCLTLAFTFDRMAGFPYMLQSCISEKMQHAPFVVLAPEETERLESWHKAIVSHCRLAAHPSRLEILCSLLFVFTAEVNAIYSAKPVKPSATHDEELTDGFFRLLHGYFRTNRETFFYASQLCISSKHLSRVITRVTGHTPVHWIAVFTVREAKMLLRSTTLTVTQLSEKLCFPNSSFFARYFKRHAGVSPLGYRAGNAGTDVKGFPLPRLIL